MRADAGPCARKPNAARASLPRFGRSHAGARIYTRRPAHTPTHHARISRPHITPAHRARARAHWHMQRAHAPHARTPSASPPACTHARTHAHEQRSSVPSSFQPIVLIWRGPEHDNGQVSAHAHARTAAHARTDSHRRAVSCASASSSRPADSMSAAKAAVGPTRCAARQPVLRRANCWRAARLDRAVQAAAGSSCEATRT